MRPYHAVCELATHEVGQVEEEDREAKQLVAPRVVQQLGANMGRAEDAAKTEDAEQRQQREERVADTDRGGDLQPRRCADVVGVCTSCREMCAPHAGRCP